MERRVTFVGIGLLLILTGSAAAQTKATNTENKIKQLERRMREQQQQMLNMQKELEALRARQVKDAETTKKQRQETVQQVQTIQEEKTMSHDPLIQKAWAGRQQSEHFPIAVLQVTATWLEETYHATPNQELAVALTLQSLILAMRQETTSATAATPYFAQAVRWREGVNRPPSARCLLLLSTTRN